MFPSHDRWGTEQDVAYADNYAIKKICIKGGKVDCKRFHQKGDRTVYVLNGTLLLDFSKNEAESNIMKLSSGQSWTILPKAIYKLGSPQGKSVELLIVGPSGEDDTFYLPDRASEGNNA